ncbi:hypothetical protein SIN8267_01121 [Sinobacterium norvegicum]|uniref:Probable membrane transporter protein n=1 Tax=Sinobacterium norvegicum TaxID=1641715 RepID=A0ABM9ADK1_9GAMM|nr:sulfite exporter TauE/SafE family protein [Sinobacterium norvegicum]CAH0991020.1 hypothetical protein SIN8267_01121 [Sinobacterium norvegicum]
MPIEFSLGIIAFITSVIAGVVGFGGGMLLIAILPIFLSPSIIIPIHGATQLASNASRMAFSLSDVKWALLPKFLAGSLIGTLLFGLLLVNMPVDTVPLAIGIYILLNLWSPRFGRFISHYESYYLIGLLQTGLSLVVGATGPLSLSVLTKQLNCKNEIIATSSMFMSISHLVKIPVFGLIGFSLFDHSYLLAMMILGSVAGSFVGTQLRRAADNQRLITIIKLLLTAMAIKMIVAVVLF